MSKWGSGMLHIAAVAIAIGFASPSAAQTERSERDEEAIERSEELAKQAEERERAEEEARRRRREPNETAIQVGEDKKIRVNWGYWHVDGPDFSQIDAAKPGDIVEITISAPIKLWIDVPLQIGEATLMPGNVAKDYPGVYSVWLKRTDAGWSAVFNEKPDVWGTMHDPSVDVAEVPLEYAKAEDIVDEFEITLPESDGPSGELLFAWGIHRWSMPFEYGG